jgi:hypothetical protein
MLEKPPNNMLRPAKGIESRRVKLAMAQVWQE